MRRPLTSALLVAGLLVLLPTAALAHASFDVRQLPAGSTQELVLRVPLERAAANDLVEVLVPGGFAVTACPGAAGWTCEQAETADGDTVVTLARGPDGAGDAERFELTVTAPSTEGVYPFPTIQTYDDGTEAAWIEEPGGDQPAPRVQVGDDTSEVEFSGDATPHTDLATEQPTAAPSIATPAPVAPTATPTVDETADDAATDVPASPDTTAARAPAEDGAAPADGSGPSTTLLVVGGLVALLALAGAVARYRSVRP